MQKVVRYLMILFCALTCVVLSLHIVKKYVIPLYNGTITDPLFSAEYKTPDLPDDVSNYLNKGVVRYAYTTLSDSEKEAYTRMLRGVCAFEPSINLSSVELKMDELQRVFTGIRNDYPELFWIYSNCDVIVSGDLVQTVSPVYNFTEEDTKALMQNVERVRDELLSRIEGKTDYEKVMFIFKYMVDATTYDINSAENYEKGIVNEDLELSCNVYGTLLKRKAICEGYAKTFQYLMNCIGVDCIYVTGVGEGVNHAWNYVKLDGSWYGMDITWCDPYTGGNDTSFKYCLTDAETINKTHTASMEYDLPAVTGGKYEYYSYNNYCLNAFSTDEISEMIVRAYEVGQDFVEIKCVSQPVYDAFVAAIKSQDIFKAFDEYESLTGSPVETINYSLEDSLCIVRLDL